MNPFDKKGDKTLSRMVYAAIVIVILIALV